MRRRTLRLALACLAAVAATGAAACGEQDIELAQDDPLYGAAVVFQQRCAGCHTLEAAGAEGSAVKANSRERKDGPNFNERVEDYESVLYAIRNGGFSSGPMPQNLVVGREAELVACFVAKYSGRPGSEGPNEPPTGASGDTDLTELPQNCPQ